MHANSQPDQRVQSLGAPDAHAAAGLCRLARPVAALGAWEATDPQQGPPRPPSGWLRSQTRLHRCLMAPRRLRRGGCLTAPVSWLSAAPAVRSRSRLCLRRPHMWRKTCCLSAHLQGCWGRHSCLVAAPALVQVLCGPRCSAEPGCSPDLLCCHQLRSSLESEAGLHVCLQRPGGTEHGCTGCCGCSSGAADQVLKAVQAKMQIRSQAHLPAPCRTLPGCQCALCRHPRQPGHWALPARLQRQPAFVWRPARPACGGLAALLCCWASPDAQDRPRLVRPRSVSACAACSGRWAATAAQRALK